MDSPLHSRTMGEPRTVTRLVRKADDSQRVVLYAGEAQLLDVHDDLVIAFDLHPGRVLHAEEVDRLRREDQLRSAKEEGLAYLSGRARTEAEVRRKLEGRGFEEDVVRRAMERLKELGYLDDDAYARRYVEARFRNRGYGPRRLRSELLRRGVAPARVEAALADRMDEADTLAAARRHAEKRWTRLTSEPDLRKRRKKLGDYLVRRGFSYETALQVIDELERRDAT